MLPEDSYVTRSGQAWKVWLSVGLLGLGGLLLIVGFTYLDGDNDTLFVVPVLGGVVSGSLALVWQAISIRCKKCRTNLGWESLNGHWPIVSKNCLNCQDGGSHNN